MTFEKNSFFGAKQSNLILLGANLDYLYYFLLFLFILINLLFCTADGTTE